MDNTTVELEIIGPFEDYRVTVNGYWVPYLRAVRVEGIISLTLDSRFGLDIPDDERALPIIEFIGNAMAVAAGYSCLGKNCRPTNQFNRRLTNMDFTHIDDGGTLNLENEH